MKIKMFGGRMRRHSDLTISGLLTVHQYTMFNS